MSNKIWYPHVPYSKNYPNLFEIERRRIKDVLGNVIVEHFGSTAVPGLGGKGYIDIYIVVDKDKLNQISEIITEVLEYEYKDHASIKNERLFFLRNTENTRYHLHLTYSDYPDYIRVIKFREFLKTHPNEAQEYERVKKLASEKANHEETKENAKKVYMDTKQGVINRIIMQISYF